MSRPRASQPTPLPLGVGGEHVHVAEAPSFGTFEGSLQTLIAGFFQASASEDDVLLTLERLFVCLARELGRIDGAARLYGVSRDETLKLLRACMAEGKQVTLGQHEKACSCEASQVLQAEVEAN